jgi:hypothetical protein
MTDFIVSDGQVNSRDTIISQGCTAPAAQPPVSTDDTVTKSLAGQTADSWRARHERRPKPNRSPRVHMRLIGESIGLLTAALAVLAPTLWIMKVVLELLAKVAAHWLGL